MRANQPGHHQGTGRGAGHNLSHSNSALRQHSIEQAALSGSKQVEKTTPVMTPVQQKYAPQMYHSAVVNNYLTSGTRILEQTPKQVVGGNQASLHQKGGRAVKNQNQQHLQQNQFNRATLKKSDMKQLQKFCEQNGLDFNAAAQERGLLTQAQLMAIQQQQQPQQSKSLSKERKFTNAQSLNNAQAYYPGTGNQNMSGPTINQRPAKSTSQQQPVQFSSHAQQYGLYQSNASALLDNSPIKNPNLASSVSQLQMVNFAIPAASNTGMQSSSSQYTLSASQSKQTIPSQRGKSGPQTNSSTQGKRASDWKKQQMMPSQMSINEAKNMAPAQSQEATAQLANMFDNQKGYHHLQNSVNNVSTASQGYLSQKASPLGRLSVERPNNPINDNFKVQKLARYPFYTGKGGANQQSTKGSINTNNPSAQSNSRRSSQDNKDLQTTYLSQKALQLGSGQTNSNSATSLDNKFAGQNRQIDSGAGVITINNSVAVGGKPSRENNFQQRTGVQVEMKSALQSRRKHGSIETYKQTGTNRADSNSNQIIRQGQGEIVPQRGLQSKTNVYAKNLGVSAATSQKQLPNVVRNQTNNSSAKTNAPSGLPVQGGVSRPSERIAASIQTNSLINNSTPMISSSGQKPSAPARISPSGEKRQQASNQSNAMRHSALSRGSIKQGSQQALSSSNHMNVSLSQTSSRGLQRSHKDSSVEQLHERRIAYEASQGKLGGQKKEGSKIPQQQLIVTHGGNSNGNPQRHARIRTNNSSLERDSMNQGNYNQVPVGGKNDKANEIKYKGQKRGAITVAKNSPRQYVKGAQQQSRDMDRYTHSSAPQQQMTGNQIADESHRNLYSQQRQVEGANSSTAAMEARTPPTKDMIAAGQQAYHVVNQQQLMAVGNHRAYIDANGQPIQDEEYLAYLHGQEQAMSRFEDSNSQQLFVQQQSSIEQYSRKLHTPNPILDGGTGSGGATTLQHQTKQLLKEQQLMLEKLGYKSQLTGPANPQQQQQVAKNSTHGFNLKQQSQISGIEHHHHHQQSSKVNLKSSQRSLASSKHGGGHKSSTDGKKATLLGHKIQNQKKETSKQQQQQQQVDGSSTYNTKVLNLSHALHGGVKQVSTKTSAQTSNTAFTVKVNNPQYVQYAINSGGSKQSVPVTTNVGSNVHKNASLKLKKNQGNVQPSNLIMYQQQLGKRSNSQEMLNNSNVNEAQLKVVLRQNQVGNGPTAAARQDLTKKPKHLKGEKRSSSQPTSVAANPELMSSLHQQQAAGNYFNQNIQSVPKYYNQQLEEQNRRLSDVVSSRQGLNSGGRSSQRSTQNINSSSQMVGKSKQHHYQQKPQAYQASSKKDELLEREERRRADLEQMHNHTKRLRKQTSVPQLAIHKPVNETNSIADQPLSVKEVGGANHSRKSKSSGPGRPQYSVNQPNAVAVPESLVTDNEKDRRLITEDDEQEIRQVASDINEKAFYGKIIRTKKAIQNDGELNKLSPRSQEIGYVMQKLERAFALTQMPPITDITFYRVGKMLGRGAFGKVNLAMHKCVRKLVALKSLNKSALTDEVQKAKQMKEVNLLQKLRHNHVVKIYETIETQKHIIIVMELCAGGDLLNYVRKRRRLKEPFAQKIFKQIVDGLSYIHSKNVAHRDIKLDNILLDGKGNVKIADFGVSRQIQPGQIMREQCGTPAYIAPEILRNRGYSLNVDVWSVGVVLFAMLYGTVPFKAQTMDELHQLILKGKYLLKEDISIEARDLLRGLLEINPKKRLSVRKIFKHPWLRGMDTSVQLFNDEERKMIKKEYTYNDGSRYNRNENEEPVDCFTLHHLESQYSTLKNQDSKSIILAPFNSTMSEQSEMQISEKRDSVMDLMEVKQQVLRFSKKCREIDRQYEFNNNGQLDNGVYHKVVANNSFEQQDKYEETQGIEIEQSLLDSFKERAKRSKSSAANARNDNLLSATEPSSFLSMADSQYQIQNNLNKPIDPAKVQKLVQFGYPERYVLDQMRDMVPNYCTAGYYLMEMDQNYC